MAKEATLDIITPPTGGCNRGKHRIPGKTAVFYKQEEVKVNRCDFFVSDRLIGVMTIFLIFFLPLGTSDYIMLADVYNIRVEYKMNNAVLFKQGDMP